MSTAYLCGGRDDEFHDYERMDYMRAYAPGASLYGCVRCGMVLMVRVDEHQADPAIGKTEDVSLLIGSATEKAIL